MDKKQVKGYWREIRRRAWEDAMNKSGAFLLLSGGLIIFMVVVAITGILYTIGIIQYPFFIDNIVANNITGLAQVIVAIVLIAYFYEKALHEIPPKIHEELGGFLENPFSLEISEPNSISATKKRWVSIEVKNNTENKYLTRCFVKLDNILDIDHKHKKGVKRGKNLTLSGDEQYPNQSGDQPFNIAAKESKKVDVAIADPKTGIAYYTHWQNQVHKIRPGAYILNLVIYGNWQDISYHPEYHVTLKFENGNFISLSDLKEGLNLATL